MIKLNNKNITYVALADSSNSIKAPKEIWYADSSNSVKLVYRRKDALIEGVDYEKYHWLVGDADAYINTLKYYRPYNDSVQLTVRDNLYPNRESKYNKYNKEEQIWGACGNNYVQSIIRSYIAGTQQQRIANNIINATTTGGDVNWAAYNVQSDINENQEHSLYISSVNDEDEYYFIYNGNTKDKLPTRYTLPELVQQDVRIFRSGLLNNDYFNGSFFNFIHYRNNVEITHLIPCKLLKPIPKWLDANGIRRQVGECGMIDLVSGKFYGNLNSTGTFTVENYYERKEWLVADIPENTRCIDLPINSDEMSYQILISKVGNTTLFETVGNKRYYVYTNNPYLKIWDITTSKNDSDDNKINLGVQDGVILNIDSSVSSFKINNIDCPKVDFPISAVAFRSGGLQPNSITQTSSIFVNGVERYIPCTLTMDLPASMDANNIARTKGTSGMWDLVSDRFYGNVASSGTFKAVNLAEGVDYEVHQWLRAEVNTSDTLMQFTVQSSNISYRKKIIQGNNCVFFRTKTNNSEWYSYTNSENNNTVLIWSDSAGSVIYSSGVSFDRNIPISIDITPNQMSFNQSSVPFYGDMVYDIRFKGKQDSYTSSITIDGIERYVPVKLLHSIPSKYDANGIARQAGECGMYDTVNDVFYGNVASSGSFTVEDDS